MFPYIKKTSKKFIFDSRLKKEEIELLKKCIGKRIISLLLENIDMSLSPNIRFSCYGRSCLQFSFFEDEQINLCFKSLYDEVWGPLEDQGGLLVQQIITKKKNLKEKILYPPHEIDKSFVVNIKYPIQSVVTAIKFYGNHEHGNIKDFDDDIIMEDLHEYGFTELPNIQCDSIEFMVIEHETGQKSIISLQAGGFWFKIDEQEVVDSSLIYRSYIKSNGYAKNIILQHEVSYSDH